MERKHNWHKNTVDLDGDTSLHFSAAAGNHSLLFNSLILGCDVDSKNRFGWTPLMQAARNGHAECVKTLIKFGADVSHRNYFGVCSISLAVASGRLEIVEVILKAFFQRGFHVSNTEKYISPVIVSVLFNNINILRYLSKYYSLNSTVLIGDLSPVIVATILNRKEVLAFLKRRGIIISKMAAETPNHNLTFLINSPTFPQTPCNTPNSSLSFLSPYLSPKSMIRQRKSSNFNEFSVPKTPNLSPIVLNHISQNSLSPNNSFSLIGNSSNHILNSRLSMTPTFLRFSSTSSNDSSVHLLHPHYLQNKNSKPRSASCNTQPVEVKIQNEIFDDVFVSSPCEENKENHEFVKILRKNSLDSCISIFEKHEIDMDLFLTLSRPDLEEIGVDWDKRDEVLELIYKCNKYRNANKF